MDRVEKHIKTFNEKFSNIFYSTDYTDIFDIALKEPTQNELLFTAVDKALKVGFIVGYNRAKAENKKKNQSRTENRGS